MENPVTTMVRMVAARVVVVVVIAKVPTSTLSTTRVTFTIAIRTSSLPQAMRHHLPPPPPHHQTHHPLAHRRPCPTAVRSTTVSIWHSTGPTAGTRLPWSLSWSTPLPHMSGPVPAHFNDQTALHVYHWYPIGD
uniref:Putative secreted protein n=1 Tax=Anopheles darlingi TaxID=43151 RepID=A0A2M4D8T3_ANODA